MPLNSMKKKPKVGDIIYLTQREGRAARGFYRVIECCYADPSKFVNLAGVRGTLNPDGGYNVPIEICEPSTLTDIPEEELSYSIF